MPCRQFHSCHNSTTKVSSQGGYVDSLRLPSTLGIDVVGYKQYKESLENKCFIACEKRGGKPLKHTMAKWYFREQRQPLRMLVNKNRSYCIIARRCVNKKSSKLTGVPQQVFHHESGNLVN